MKTLSDVRPLVGVVVPTVDNAFFSNLADHAERYLYEKGYTALILSSANNAEKEKDHLRALCRRICCRKTCRWCGWIGAPSPGGKSRAWPTMTGLRWRKRPNI